MKITYDVDFKTDVIAALDLKIGKDGFLVHKKSNTPITNDNGEPIKAKEFGGIQKGSIHYYKNDLPAMIELSKRLRAK